MHGFEELLGHLAVGVFRVLLAVLRFASEVFGEGIGEAIARAKQSREEAHASSVRPKATGREH